MPIDASKLKSAVQPSEDELKRIKEASDILRANAKASVEALNFQSSALQALKAFGPDYQSLVKAAEYFKPLASQHIDRLVGGNYSTAMKVLETLRSIESQNLDRLVAPDHRAIREALSQLTGPLANNPHSNEAALKRFESIRGGMVSAVRFDRIVTALDANIRRQLSVSDNLRELSPEGAETVAEEATNLIQLPERKALELNPKSLVVAGVVSLRQLIADLAKDPELRYGIDDREFEFLVAELLRRSGYDVRVTKQSRDGGKDVIAVKTDLAQRTTTFVECKRYAAHKTVGDSVVQRLYGVVMSAKGSTSGLVVATSKFSKPALQFVEENSNRISVKDGDRLIEWIRSLEGLTDN